MINRWGGALFTTLYLTLFFLVLWIVYGHSTSSFPPLAYLASELGVTKGTQLQKGVIYNGRPFFFYIVGAQKHPNGRYTVELQAR